MEYFSTIEEYSLRPKTIYKYMQWIKISVILKIAVLFTRPYMYLFSSRFTCASVFVR